MTGIRKLVVAGLTMVLLMLFVSSVQAQSRRCNDPPDPGINVIIAPGDHILLGTFARPHTGRDFIVIDPDGTRTIPPNLNINDPTKEVFQEARVTLTGGSFCEFRIRLNNRSSNQISTFRVAPGAGYTLSSNRSGARGVLDAAGNFEFTLGVTARVRASDPVGAYLESFDVTVFYR